MTAPENRPEAAPTSAARHPAETGYVFLKLIAAASSGTAAQDSVMSKQTNAPSQKLSPPGGGCGCGAPSAISRNDAGPSTDSVITAEILAPSPSGPDAVATASAATANAKGTR